MELKLVYWLDHCCQQYLVTSYYFIFQKMINNKILKFASNTKNVGLKNKYTHKISAKNSICGDIINLELILNKSIIKSMKYETESCILCEASASLLAQKVKSKNINILVKEIKELKMFLIKKNLSLPSKFKEFKYLINRKSHFNRTNCVTLPLEAFLKAFKINE